MADQGDDPSKRGSKTWNSGAGGPPPSSGLQAPVAPPRPATRQVLPTNTSHTSLPAVTPTTELAARRARIEELEMQLGRANQELGGARTTIQSLFEKTETQAARIVQLEAANARLHASNALLEKSNAALESQVGDLIVELAQSENATLEAVSVVLTGQDRRQACETVEIEGDIADIHVEGRDEPTDKRSSLTEMEAAAAIAKLIGTGDHDTDAHEPIHDQRRTMTGMLAAPPAVPLTSRTLKHWQGSAGDTRPFDGLPQPPEPPKKS